MKKYSLLFLMLFSSSVIVSLANTEVTLGESFIKAVDQKNYEKMKDLLDKGADINGSYLEGKYTPLSSAASVGDLKLVKFLIERGADINGSPLFPNSPIYLAISGNHFGVVSYFLDKGVDPNYAWPGEDEGTLLINAIQFGHLDIVKLLLARGADVNSTGNGNHSPLYRSIIYDRFEIFEFLLKHDAKLNNYDNVVLDEFKWKSIKENQKFVRKLEAKESGAKP